VSDVNSFTVIYNWFWRSTVHFTTLGNCQVIGKQLSIWNWVFIHFFFFFTFTFCDFTDFYSISLQYWSINTWVTNLGTLDIGRVLHKHTTTAEKSEQNAIYTIKLQKKKKILEYCEKCILFLSAIVQSKICIPSYVLCKSNIWRIESSPSSFLFFCLYVIHWWAFSDHRRQQSSDRILTLDIVIAYDMMW